MPTSSYVGSHEMRWPDRTGPWLLEFHFALVKEGWVECIGVDVRSFKLGKNKVARPIADVLEQIDSSVWRSIPIQSLVSEAIEDFVDMVASPGTEGVPGRKWRRSGPTPFWTPERLAEVARVYKANLGTRSPTRAVAVEFEVSPSMAAKLVARARDAGLLGKTTKGRAGVEPTKKSKGRSRR